MKKVQKLIAIIGLGYVGLPLAVEFGRKRKVIGFDIDKVRIDNLKKGLDNTLECTFEELQEAKYLEYCSEKLKIKTAQIYIITVPTPVDKSNRPDLKPLIEASKTIGEILKIGDIVIYESTVYPGATEEICVPILEQCSKLKFNKDFYCGYSPERINPGDKLHRLSSIKKVTSGSTIKIAEEIDFLYKEIITVGTHRASSIKVAEASKIIENTQRDVNIALMNELSLIFNKLGINTREVLNAAGTKWNFLPFRPGLVGGHCIGVDPYYLTHKAQEVGYHPEVILAGRRINDSMASYVADETIKLMLKKEINLKKSKILILGFTFKENCPDVRNTKVYDIYKRLLNYNINVEIYDPWINIKEAEEIYKIKYLKQKPRNNKYEAIIIAVAHKEIINMGVDVIRKFGKINAVVYDVKSILRREDIDGCL